MWTRIRGAGSGLVSRGLPGVAELWGSGWRRGVAEPTYTNLRKDWPVRIG
jgi:hypothetical protein